MTVVLTILLLACSAGFSGLTLGLMSLDVHELKRKADLGDELAKKVLPIRERGNELLVTLILGNVLVNTVLTVVLDRATNGLIAVALATGLIVIFGEIVPQAILGRYGLKFGAKIAPGLQKLLLFFALVSKPLAHLLDRTLGKEMQTFYSRDELIKIIEEHGISEESDIAYDELRIVQHALTFGDKLIKDVMTPRSMIIGVGKQEKTSLKLMNELHQSGHSRFPVFEKTLDKVVGTLFIRDLVAEKGIKTVGTLMKSEVYYVNMDEKLDHALNAFLRTKHHLFIVVNEFSETVGVITIEDVIEQIMGRKIVDEFDRFEDIRAVALKNAKKTTTVIEKK